MSNMKPRTFWIIFVCVILVAVALIYGPTQFPSFWKLSAPKVASFGLALLGAIVAMFWIFKYESPEGQIPVSERLAVLVLVLSVGYMSIALFGNRGKFAQEMDVYANPIDRNPAPLVYKEPTGFYRTDEDASRADNYYFLFVVPHADVKAGNVVDVPTNLKPGSRVWSERNGSQSWSVNLAP